MTGVSPERLRRDIVGLAHRGLDVRDYAIGVARLLRRRVPFDGFCLLLLDPATLLPTGEIVENGLPDAVLPRMAEIEIGEPDVNKFTDLARAQRPAASLSEATSGDLDRSLRHREVKGPLGFGDELRVALVGHTGTWGGITLLREAARPKFTPTDAAILGSLSGDLVEGLQRAILLTERPAAGDGETDDTIPGVLLLAGDGSIEMADAAARRWLAELDGDRRPDGDPSAAIAAVAQRARVAATGRADVPAATARIRTASGRWLVARGSVVGDGPDARAAVILEPAHAHHLAPMLAEAYGLTAREQDVTQLVARGLSTSDIASQLYLSSYTVQDHLKSIFDKIGVATRGQLVARLFLDHYAPRLASSR